MFSISRDRVKEEENAVEKYTRGNDLSSHYTFHRSHHRAFDWIRLRAGKFLEVVRG